jgi:tRNA1Val (adenine37-N6)-methyltransferase
VSTFRFKRFEVVNERSAMKVNTDGVLLGAAMTIMPEDRCMLDIGTGTGTIALMAAQRVCNDVRETGAPDEDVRVICDSVKIDAIDVDEPSATEAAMNFANSPWSESLHAHNMSLDDFAMSLPEDRSYDLIFSNPPYFEDSLTAPDERKSTARHTSDGLSYRDIFEFAKERLNDSGRVSLVLPADQEAALCRYARMCGLHLFRILRVRTVPRKAPSRMIAEFSRHRCETVKEELLTIQNEGQYTQEYLSLTHEFYLFA